MVETSDTMDVVEITDTDEVVENADTEAVVEIMETEDNYDLMLTIVDFSSNVRVVYLVRQILVPDSHTVIHGIEFVYYTWPTVLLLPGRNHINTHI